jgi:hypothetical protein
MVHWSCSCSNFAEVFSKRRVTRRHYVVTQLRVALFQGNLLPLRQALMEDGFLQGVAREVGTLQPQPSGEA